MSEIANVVLSEQTITALRFIESYRYLTVNQVARVTRLKPKSTSEMLLRMQRQKLLGHFGNVPIRGYGKTPKVYFLTRRGHRMLGCEIDAEEEELHPYRPINRSSRWSPIMYHRIATLDVMMSLERAIGERPSYSLPATFTEYRRQKIGTRLVGETTDYIALPQISENKIVPDAGFVLQNLKTKARALFLIEVDLGTTTLTSTIGEHAPRSFCYKIQKYEKYLTGRRFRERYQPYGEFSHFTTLIITNSDKRSEHMRRILSDLPHELHQFFRFSTLDDVCGSFFHSNWRSRLHTDQTAYSLIKEGESHEN